MACICASFTLAFTAGESRSEETNLFGAHMQQPEIVVSPVSNGVMELICKVPFIGGCCFPLTSHDVTASLDIPAGMAVVNGPEPLNYPSIDAPPGMTPLVWAIFHWRLQRTSPDSSNQLTVTVSSPDSGQVKATYTLSQQASMNVTSPRSPDILTSEQNLDIAAPVSETKSGNMRWWIVVGAFFAAVVAAGMIRRRGVFTIAGITLLLAVVAGLLWIVKTPPVAETAAVGYPTNSSTVAYLFLDRGETSRLLAEQMETYRRVVPHRLHVLCFVEGVTPAPIMRAYRDRYHVGQTPTVVFDGHVSADGTNAPSVAMAMDRCFGKPASRLSMELRGGVIAGHELSLGFIMCNHASRKDAHGSVSAFAFENGVDLGGWRCDHVVRNVMLEDRQYAIPTGKCQPPAMFKWDIPTGVVPAQTGALTVIMDEEGFLIDSICTEQPCSRTGVCG